MFVIQIIPLIRGTKIDTLSYYSSVEYAIGTFLSVPVRGKDHRAIVTDCKPVAESKSSLKSASFTLRKLPEQSPLSVVPSNLQATALKLTETYPSSVGAILYQLLPPDVRTGQYQYPIVSSQLQHEDTIPQVLTAAIKERYVSYRSHVRSVLARRGSVVFIVPTSADVQYANEHLTQGIEDRVVVFSPAQTKHQREKAYADYEDTSLAKLIITTPSHAYLDRVDLLSVVIEQSASDFYRTSVRPYLDHRTALLAYAKSTGRSILLGDVLPRTEDEYRRRMDIYNTYNDTTKRIIFAAPLTLIEQHDKSTPENPFALFSKELRARVQNIIDAKGRIFMYGARRGIAPVVTCIDCGYIFRCPDSETPYSLVKTISKTGNEERWFVSGTSGKKIRAADTCPGCGGWRLRPRGIGIQHVYDEAKTYFPTAKIFLLDHTTATTRKRAQKIIDDFYATRGAVLVGTQMALPYLRKQGVELSAVISLDATRSNPTWRADENTFRLLLELRELSHQEVMLQTRTSPDSVLQNAIHGSVELFYNEEIELREQLLYPPFSTFILLSWTGEKSTIVTIEEMLKTITKDFVGTYYSNPASTEAKILRHALYRIAPSDKNKASFINTLKSLPPYIRIEIDPARIV
jgi:primosomal protein N'